MSMSEHHNGSTSRPSYHSPTASRHDFPSSFPARDSVGECRPSPSGPLILPSPEWTDTQDPLLPGKFPSSYEESGRPSSRQQVSNSGPLADTHNQRTSDMAQASSNRSSNSGRAENAQTQPNSEQAERPAVICHGSSHPSVRGVSGVATQGDVPLMTGAGNQEQEDPPPPVDISLGTTSRAFLPYNTYIWILQKNRIFQISLSISLFLVEILLVGAWVGRAPAGSRSIVAQDVSSLLLSLFTMIISMVCFRRLERLRLLVADMIFSSLWLLLASLAAYELSQASQGKTDIPLLNDRRFQAALSVRLVILIALGLSYVVSWGYMCHSLCRKIPKGGRDKQHHDPWAKHVSWLARFPCCCFSKDLEKGEAGEAPASSSQHHRSRTDQAALARLRLEQLRAERPS
ncbi:hypothetical protein HD806DRAFT_487115 [Xylariaceae sp. AK1471]|nr:hypothetical protein HD806DRAFT_487115 [Xylariaceae sp. AK1471]